MAPHEFSIRLQRGITGGFAPPTPSEIHTLTKPSTHPSLQISSSVREDGTPDLQSFGPSKSLPLSSSATSSSTESLVDELQSLLRTLPTESPPGSEDIYGMDTSIAWGSDDLMWMNGGPAGCGGGLGSSMVTASKEDKAKFGRAVGIIRELVKRAE